MRWMSFSEQRSSAVVAVDQTNEPEAPAESSLYSDQCADYKTKCIPKQSWTPVEDTFI